MDLQNRGMHLVLSTDAKPRLKWIPELHQRFLDAVNQLGGPEKATPKGLMRVMGIPGLTLYHLKSHLQKFRLGKSQQIEISSDSKQEDYREVHSSDGHCRREISIGTQNQMTEGLQIAQAFQVQMEVQRKLYEQIEVQRHLQLRIEAQGKYLQSVLKNAQEALSGHNSSAAGIELAKAELSKLLSIINNGCPGSPISELTETRVLGFKNGERKQSRGTMCSLESSLTSSESSGRKKEKQPMEETQKSNTISFELTLMAIHPEDKPCKVEASGRKRSGGTDSDESCVDQPCGNKLRRLEVAQMLDLNSLYQNDESSSKGIDLNS
ncbi:hypothetical protein L6164_027084 [Bauhinia variegata]|uniref:Uncharacterized protein n=1 Tax=Bauhinia variegata TaxID=167791 RepID=A0ACB9LSU8_BAUVA|nr:hypothetical protein L6164_027084 [Bauhinia variegata]